MENVKKKSVNNIFDVFQRKNTFIAYKNVSTNKMWVLYYVHLICLSILHYHHQGYSLSIYIHSNQENLQFPFNIRLSVETILKSKKFSINKLVVPIWHKRKGNKCSGVLWQFDQIKFCQSRHMNHILTMKITLLFSLHKH